MHTRLRHIEQILLKRSKIFPAVGLLGPRQVGKSTFLIKQWKKKKNAVYFTLDKQDVLTRAKRAPEQFLLSASEGQKIHLIIDEAQKVPHLFDSIKAIVDENRRVGSFTLSGSVDFSLKSGVRESLAGRLGITRLYPMTIRELHQLEFRAPWVTLKFKKTDLPHSAVAKWLERGGMPLFAELRNQDERFGAINSWLEAICYRDLHQLKDGKYDSEIAFNLLQLLAIDSKAVASKLSLELGASSLAIKKHLAALESLLLLYRIPSFENPRALAEYRIFDSGVMRALVGGRSNIYTEKSSLEILILNEILAQYEYSGVSQPGLFFYKTRGGAEINLILKLKNKNKLVAIEAFTSVDIPLYRQRAMRGFIRKYPHAVGYFVAPVQESYQEDKNLFVIPWGSIV